MTREEQIIQASDEWTYQKPPQYSELVHKTHKVMCAYQVGFIDGAVWADRHPDINVRTMAAWRGGYKEAIDKACEWLKEEYSKAAAYYEHPDSFIDRFKQATKVD